jgi:hypothetical protein
LKGYAIKQPVFSSVIHNVNKALGPEMKSTGESILFIDLKTINSTNCILEENVFEQISSSHYIEKPLIGAFFVVVFFFERTTWSHNIFVVPTFEI